MSGLCRRFYRDIVPLSVWEAVYRELAAAGRLEASFPGVEDPSLEFFLDLMARPDRHSWALTFGREAGGVAYITDREGTSARVHFAFLPTKTLRTKGGEAHERLPAPVALGRFFLASVLRDRFQGGYVLDTLVGVTPVANTPAVNMILRCGAVALGVIPGACPRRGEGRNANGLVTYYTRESTDDSWCFL